MRLQWHNRAASSPAAPPPVSALNPAPAPVPAPARSHWERLADLALLAVCVGVAGWIAVRMGQDANWDLQNYHYYIGWAWWHDHRAYTIDIAAAQLQTYHNPLLDLPFFLMVDAGWDPRTISVVLAAPAGIAGYFALRLAPLLFADDRAKTMFTGLRTEHLDQAVRLTEVHHEVFGDDTLTRGGVVYPPKLSIDEAVFSLG